VLNFRIETELSPVFDCVFGVRFGEPKRADDAGRWRVKCGNGNIAHIWLYITKLLPLYDTKPFHAVFQAVFVKLIKLPTLRIVYADDKAADTLKFYVEFLC
jgi:hypothetical protein